MQLREFLAEQNVAVGTTIAAIFLGAVNSWYPALCLRRAERQKQRKFSDCSFRVMPLAYLWPCAFLTAGGWLAQHVIVDKGNRRYVLLILVIILVIAALFYAFTYKRIVAEFREGAFTLREGSRTWKLSLKDIQEVKLGYGAVDVYYSEKQRLRLPITLERLPTVIAMLKYYRPIEFE